MPNDCSFPSTVSFLDAWQFIDRVRQFGSLDREQRWQLGLDATCLQGAVISMIKNGTEPPFFDVPPNTTLEELCDGFQARVPAGATDENAAPVDLDPATALWLLQIVMTLFGGNILDWVRRLFGEEPA